MEEIATICWNSIGCLLTAEILRPQQEDDSKTVSNGEVETWVNHRFFRLLFKNSLKQLNLPRSLSFIFSCSSHTQLAEARTKVDILSIWQRVVAGPSIYSLAIFCGLVLLAEVSFVLQENVATGVNLSRKYPWRGTGSKVGRKLPLLNLYGLSCGCDPQIKIL